MKNFKMYQCLISCLLIIIFLPNSLLQAQHLEVEGDLDVHNHQIKNLADPADPTDGISKKYLDEQIIQFAASLGSQGVQALLSQGYDPLALINAGVEKDSLYGRSYAGGLIFYLDDLDTLPGIKGMVAATVDQSIGAAKWKCADVTISGATGITIGTGNQNSLNIGLQCQSDGSIAANLCLDLPLNGFYDWFLPSKDELLQMYYKIGPGAPGPNATGLFQGNYYWSSSRSGSEAWAIGFVVFNTLPLDQGSSLSVRAARAF